MSKQPTVVWISEVGDAAGDAPAAPRTPGEAADRRLAGRLRELGIDVVHARPDEAERIAAEAAVRRFAEPASTLAHGVHALSARARPTLWLADDDRVERLALQAAALHDDVWRSSDDAATLKSRLDRLLERRRTGSPDGLHDLDALTGLPNRRAFGRLLRRALEDLIPGEHKALVMVDLDHFKAINDGHGHEAGDRVLQRVADVLRAGLGPDDHVGRIGGDEFVVLLTRYDAPSLVSDAGQLLRDIARPIVLPGLGEVALTASAGLVMLRPGTTEPQVLRQADSAAYEAKAQGRGRVVHFELIHDGGDAGPEADLQRFTEVTRMFSDRMGRMVSDMGRRLVEAARVQALQDPLTGARNRGFFKERLPREIERARAGGRPLSMALIDVDHFHDVNLSYGWPSGDAVLQRFVGVAAASLRVVDWLARYGGEEFAVVLPDTDLDAAFTVLERLREAIASTEFTALDGRRITVTVSVGLASLADSTQDAIALADDASRACLAAKRGGRNRVALHRRDG